MQRHLQPAENSWSAPLCRSICSCVVTILALSISCAAQSSVAPSDVEAAYLYNFGKFVEWPPLASAPFSICIVGKDDFGKTLDSLIAHESMQGRNIVAKRLPAIAGADEACQIVYIGTSELPRLGKDLEALKDKPVLTVSALPTFLEHGGMIQFVLEENRVRFAVNLAAAERAHLTLSAELLKVALYVNSRPSQEGQ